MSASAAITVPDAEVLRRRLRRLALDIHDGPMQSLVAIGSGLRLVSHGLEGHAPRAAFDQLELLEIELIRAEQGLRSLITELEAGGTTVLEPLEQIADAELSRFHRRCAAETDVSVQPNVYPDSDSQRIAIRSILREALNNIAKHADAQSVHVRLQTDETGFQLEVADDGRGFNAAALGCDGLGLRGMRDRAEFLGGTLTVASEPGGPTSVTATLPHWHPGAGESEACGGSRNTWTRAQGRPRVVLNG